MSFKCQRCRQTLRLDDSLSNLDQASADMLIGKEIQLLLYSTHYEI